MWNIAVLGWGKVNGLVKVTIEKCGLDVNLVTLKVEVIYKGEKNSD